MRFATSCAAGSADFPAGSVLTRTLVRPLPGKDADADAVAFKKDGIHLSPREWLDCLLAELKARAAQLISDYVGSERAPRIFNLSFPRLLHFDPRNTFHKPTAAKTGENTTIRGIYLNKQQLTSVNPLHDRIKKIRMPVFIIHR